MNKKTCIAAAYGLGALALGGIGLLMGEHGQVLGITAAGVASNIQDNFSAIADLMGGGSYLAGAAFGIQSALKFKAHNENPQQVKLSQPLTYALVAGALLALPSWLSVAASSPFGNDAQMTTITGSNRLGR